MKMFAWATVLAVLVVPRAGAAEVTGEFYGELNIAYDVLAPGDDDFANYVSRLGFKGSYPIGTDVQLVFQIEQEVDPVHGGDHIDTLFSMRNTFIGLEGGFGKLIFGAHDTPLKRAQGKVDLFNDQAGDIKSLLPGEVRSRDSFFYYSPRFEGVQVQLAYVPGDGDFGSSQSVSVSWDRDELSMAFAADADMRKNERGVARTAVYDSMRLAIQYTPGAWQLGLLAQRSAQQNAVAATETGYVVSVGYELGDVGLLGQYGNADILSMGATSLNAGVHYRFSSTGKVYFYYWNYDDGTDSDIFSIGAEYKF